MQDRLAEIRTRCSILDSKTYADILYLLELVDDQKMTLGALALENLKIAAQLKIEQQRVRELEGEIGTLQSTSWLRDG